MDAEVRNAGRLISDDNIRTGGLIEEYLCYLGEMKNRSALTLDSYRNDLDQFTAFLAGSASADACDIDARILNFNSDDAGRFVDLLKDQYTRSTLNRKITAVRGLYGYLVLNNRLSANPFGDVRIAPAPETSVEYLEEGHLQQLFDAIVGNHWLASRDRAVVAILYSTGMRVSELLGLCVDDIDSESLAIHIRAAGKPTRLCYLAPWAWHAVERYMTRRPVCLTNSSPKDVLFVNRDGGPLSARSVRRKLTEYSRRADLPVEVTPAILRHSCAIYLLRNGADIKTVRELLGHLSASSIRPYLSCLSDIPDQSDMPSKSLQIAGV